LFSGICQAAEKAGFSCAASAKGGWSELTVPVPRPSRYQGLIIRPVQVPVAFLGLAYFVFIVAWFGLVGAPRAAGRPWGSVPVAAAGSGAVASLFFLGLMASGRAAPCVWCLATHVVNLLMILSIWRLTRFASAGALVTHREAIGAMAVSLVLVGGLWVYRSDQLAMHENMKKLLPFKQLVKSMREDPAFLRREHFARDPVGALARQDRMAPSGRAQLVIFNDYQCPKCACAGAAAIQQAKQAFDGQLDVIVRQYPLCDACNPNVTSAFHAEACEAAYAAEAARLQGGDEVFRRMHELLHANADHLGMELYRRLADQLGLDADRLAADMSSDGVRQIVAEDIEAGKRAGVVGTPTLFLNGRPVNLVFDGPVFWKAMAEAWADPSGMRQAALPVTTDLSMAMSLEGREE
jgi:protein-disulfide isomerase